MSSSLKELLAVANGSVPAISPQDAKALIDERVAMVQAWTHENMGAHENVMNE